MAISIDDIKELHLISEHIRQYEQQGEESLFGPCWRDLALHGLTHKPDGRLALSQREGLGVAERHQLVELLDGYLPREQPEANHVALFRLFMQQKQETCFHESEAWTRRYVFAGTVKAPWFSDDTVEDNFNPDDLYDSDDIIPD